MLYKQIWTRILNNTIHSDHIKANAVKTAHRWKHLLGKLKNFTTKKFYKKP